MEWAPVIARAVIVSGAGFLWTTLFWFAPAEDWPAWHTVWQLTDKSLSEATGLAPAFVWALRGALFVLLALVVVKAAVRRPLLFGAGPLGLTAVRLVGACLAVAVPVLVVLGSLRGMKEYYAILFGVDGWRWALANGLGIVVEHAWIEGVVLGAALPLGIIGRRESRRSGRLAVLGLGYPTEDSASAPTRTLSAWLGVPRTAWPAIFGAALVFFAIHMRKHPAEIFTSLPGGIAEGWLTVRTQSFWPGAVLHVATGAIVLAAMAASH